MSDPKFSVLSGPTVWPDSDPSADMRAWRAYMRNIVVAPPRIERVRMTRVMFNACSLSSLRRELDVLEILERDGSVHVVDLRRVRPFRPP